MAFAHLVCSVCSISALEMVFQPLFKAIEGKEKQSSIFEFSRTLSPGFFCFVAIFEFDVSFEIDFATFL